MPPALKPFSERRVLDGPAGAIEVLVEAPASVPLGLALIGHPHPLFGGTMENKVAATLARAFLALGWVAVRPNFRGVGTSAGVHDDGRGETQDFLWLIDELGRWPRWQGQLGRDASLALAGFSFGSFVAAGAARELAVQGRAPQVLVLVGAAAGKWPMPEVDSRAIVIHGEVDETIPLADVFVWARVSDVPVIVIPGADHFFHRRLTTLKQLVMQNVLGMEAGQKVGDE